MTHIVNGIDISRAFTADEVADLYHSGRLGDVSLAGYVAQATYEDGAVIMRFVHWTKANALTPGENSGGLRDFVVPEFETALQESVKRDSPIRKRAPQERLASMMVSLMSEANSEGINGLTEEFVRSIVGEAWKRGEPIPAEAVRRVAAHYLGGAEQDALREARAQRGRAGRKARREQERLERRERQAYERRKAAQG